MATCVLCCALPAVCRVSSLRPQVSGAQWTQSCLAWPKLAMAILFCATLLLLTA